MTQRFTTSQWIPFPVEQVFAFFANPANLPRLMPENLRTRIEDLRTIPPPLRSAAPHLPAKSMDVVAGEGSEILISFQPIPFVPIRSRWTARIVAFRWNIQFCDEQVRGPFAAFKHCHSVCAEVRGGVTGTVVTDEIEFRLPFGLVGKMAGFFVRSNLSKAFAYRQSKLPDALKHLEAPANGCTTAPGPVD